jgi:hypothetical protein
MILISNHLLGLPQFQKLEDVVVRINMAHVKDMAELRKFLKCGHPVFLDYPKGRTKPPVPTIPLNETLTEMAKHDNIEYFAVSNVEDVTEVKVICDALPDGVGFVPKIETLKGVLNLDSLLATGLIKHIMLDSEDLYTNVLNDVDLYLYLNGRVEDVCVDHNVSLLKLHGVIFNDS